MQQNAIAQYKETIDKFEEQIKKIEALDEKLKKQVKIHQDRSKLMIIRSYKKKQEDQIKNLNLVIQSNIDREIQECIENGLKYTDPIQQKITKIQELKKDLNKLVGQLTRSKQIIAPKNRLACNDGYSVFTEACTPSISLVHYNTVADDDDVEHNYNSIISNIEKSIYSMYNYITETMEEFKNNDIE